MPAIEVPDWYRTVALVGVDITGEPVVVLLDSTGAIMAVMKGEYAGTLKNIAVDSSGRVIMIPTDPADIWGNAISMGNAELAARLTGLGGFDRRGNAIFATTFEDGLVGWATALSGTGAEIVLSTTTSRKGGYSVKMTPGSDANRLVDLYRYFPYPKATKFGFEVCFTVTTNVEYIQIILIFRDGTNVYTASVRYDESAKKFEYQDSAGNWQELLTSKNLIASTYAFHTMKLVVDADSKKYVRFLINDSEVSMSGYGVWPVASTSAPMLQPWVRITADAGTNPNVYLDSAILTQNEPA